MARTLLWCIKEQRVVGIYPTSGDADSARDSVIKERNRVDAKQHGRPELTSSDFQTLSVN